MGCQEGEEKAQALAMLTPVMNSVLLWWAKLSESLLVTDGTSLLDQLMW
jgi:hypothetical protein